MCICLWRQEGRAGSIPRCWTHQQSKEMLGDPLPGRRHVAAGDQTHSHLLCPHGDRHLPGVSYPSPGICLDPGAGQQPSTPCLGCPWGRGVPGAPALSTVTLGAAAKCQSCPCLLGVLIEQVGKENQPRELHGWCLMGMGWTSGTGTFPPSRVVQGEGMCMGFGEDIGLCSLGRGWRPPPALTLRWSSWACGPPLPSIS